MKLTEENIKEIAKLAQEGQNSGEIANAVTCSELQVKNAIRKLRKLGVNLPTNRSSYEKVANELKAEAK